MKENFGVIKDRVRVRLFVLSFFFSLISPFVWSQASSTQNRFEVSAVRGCVPLQVTATNTSGSDPTAVPIVWNMNWDGDQGNIVVDQNQSASQADTIYTEPGVYQILQVIGNQSDPIDTLTVEVLPDNPPAFQVSNCINNSIYIDFSQDTLFDNFIIDFGDGTSGAFSASAGGYAHSYASQGDYTVSVQGTFVGGSLSCSVYDTIITTVRNLEIAEINIVRVRDEQTIEIAYDLADANVSYRLEVSENSNTDYNFAAVDLNNENTVIQFSDSRLNTRDNYYCFRIVAVNRCDESLNQLSNVVCSVNLTVEAENDQNVLSWRAPGASSFSIGRDNQSIGTTTDQTLTDTDIVCQELYSYIITASTTDNAISVSDEVEVTAISVNTPEALVQLRGGLEETNARITWQEATEAVRYYIYKAQPGNTPELIDSLVASGSVRNGFTDPSPLQPDVRYCFQVSYTDECGNESEISEEVCVVLPRQARIFVPTAFTPDGDGLNDEFIYKADLLTSVIFTIYNRWGELIFSTDELDKGWDGTYNALVSPSGIYLFKLEVEDELGNAFTRTGSFRLMR